MDSTVIEKRTETIRHILEAAKDIFSEAGFAGARVDEIARRAGVNKAALYYHIGDKKALYAEVLHDVLGGAAERMAEDLALAKTPEEKLKTYVHNLAQTIDKNPQMPRIMMREIASGGQNLPDVFFHDFSRIINILTTIIEEGAKTGVFIDATPILVHMMAWGAIVICKTGVPIITGQPGTPDSLKNMGKNLQAIIAPEVESLILRALKR